MKCSTCNEDVIAKASFCVNCGSKIEKPREMEPEESPKYPEPEESPKYPGPEESPKYPGPEETPPPVSVTEPKPPQASVPEPGAPEKAASEPPLAAAPAAAPPPLPPQAAAVEPGYVTSERHQPLGIGKYLLAILVFSIPLVNIIMMIVWAIGAKNINLRNFAIAAILWLIIIIVVSAALWAVIGVFISMYFEQIMDQIFNSF